MSVLVAGLVLFLGMHSIRIFADGLRSAQVARMGEARWKLVYTVVSLAGFGLIIYGYGLAYQNPVVLWNPPLWTRHVAALLVLIAFILFAASFVRLTRIRAAVGHPMVASVKVWAFAHLLANGTLADVVLFGSFLAWAVVDYISLRRRDRAAGREIPPGSLARDAIAVVAGVVLYVVFALWLHGWLFGVRPFG